jgi:hypothetical protein
MGLLLFLGFSNQGIQNSVSTRYHHSQPQNFSGLNGHLRLFSDLPGYQVEKYAQRLQPHPGYV